MPKISIIVPVYNVEKYLRKCIESILAQTYTNFEVLLINDGSQDNSGIICDEYAKKEQRIKAYHKKNGGVSSARNFGLNNAVGEWILFIDSDDWVNNDYIKELINAIVDEKIGLIIQGISYIERGRITKTIDFGNLFLSRMDILRAFIEKQIVRYGFPFSKLYSRSIIENYKLRFDESIHYSEDLLFMLSYILYTEYICFVSGSNYNYNRDINLSSSHKYYSYESEYSLYTSYRGIIHNIFMNNVPENVVAAGGSFLSRALGTMYRPDTYKKRESRMNILKQLTEDDLMWIRPYKSNNILFAVFAISNYLLRHRLLRLFDIYVMCLYYIRYQVKKQ